MKVFIFYISLLIFISSCFCSQTNTYLQNKIKPKYFNGQVRYKYIDTADRMTPKVRFVDGFGMVVDAYEMYDDIQPGDSIVKEVGSLKYVLKRAGEDPREYYPKCDGKEIK